MKMYKGETLGLVGESGCGKSTIAYTVVGMYGATSGQVIYDNMDMVKKGYRRTLKQKGDIQIVFQDPGSVSYTHLNHGTYAIDRMWRVII